MELWMTPTNLLDATKQSNELWHCKDGIAANIKFLASEITVYRGSAPITIFNNGPPASGKTYYA